MGRPPSEQLQIAYQLLADGKWHQREQLLRAMMPTVSVGKALRRGQATSRTDDLSTAEYIRRGQRHLCIVALTNSVLLEQALVDGIPMVRLKPPPAKPAAEVRDIPISRDEARIVDELLGHVLAHPQLYVSAADRVRAHQFRERLEQLWVDAPTRTDASGC